MTYFLPLLAQDAAPTPSLLGSPMVLMVIMIALMYFVIFRPQRKAQKAQEEMRKGVRVGDKVVTIGGAHGIVSGLTDKTVSVKVADGLSIKFDRSAIATVTDSKAAKEEETKAEA
jgi:preprotein translocase subunit YajC